MSDQVNTRAKEVYVGGGSIADALVESLTGILSKASYYALKSKIFGALMDAYNAGIAAGVEKARRDALKPTTAPSKSEVFHYPLVASRDGVDTIQFRTSAYFDGMHLSGNKSINADDPTYIFWLWIIDRAINDEDLQGFDLAKLADLAVEFESLKTELVCLYVDRQAILNKIPLDQQT